MKNVCFDFDGVIHSYKSGWKGIDIIPDPPVDGIKEVIRELKDSGYEIIIFTTRAAEWRGAIAVCRWCEKYEIPYDSITALKPPSVVYVDDRGLKFEGNTNGLVDKIKGFHSWVERRID